MSTNAFGQALHVPTNRITAILKGTRSITADTALRISRFFGTTTEFWLNLQTSYDLKIARQPAMPPLTDDGSLPQQNL